MDLRPDTSEFLRQIASLRRAYARLRLALGALVLMSLGSLVGCGTTQSKALTEQLLVSDAVDRAIQQIDFSDLSEEQVYLDNQFLKPILGPAFVNAHYVESSLRQHLVASGARLQDTKETADIIVEARLGAMGSDGHEVVYGIPQNNTISNAASMLPNTPQLPTMPEISVGKTSIGYGAAKVAIFAYERVSREPLWQSGVLIGRSNSRDVWVLGAGPVQSGSIYASTRFAGQRLAWLPFIHRPPGPKLSPVPYMAEMHFETNAAEERLVARNKAAAEAAAQATAAGSQADVAERPGGAFVPPAGIVPGGSPPPVR